MLPDPDPIESVVLPPAADPAHEPEQAPALVELLAGALRAAAVALVIGSLGFNLSVVRGGSMRPGIRDGDRILVDHVSYLLREVRRGDVVVLRCPLDPVVDYVKRVVGLPGDEIEIEGGVLRVNGEPLLEPYVDEPDKAARHRETVAPGHVFVLGDNRPHSSDSREFGAVPLELLRGKVEWRVWPLERLGAVP